MKWNSKRSFPREIGEHTVAAHKHVLEMIRGQSGLGETVDTVADAPHAQPAHAHEDQQAGEHRAEAFTKALYPRILYQFQQIEQPDGRAQMEHQKREIHTRGGATRLWAITMG
ncbi:MAG: hypothetical protein IPH53_18975 [Flavobacteriales bacterium]|nr:hypothetical protein [Flavobacteriales bacterium]